MKLNDSTASITAIAGKSTRCGESNRWERASLSIDPQLAVGGATLSFLGLGVPPPTASWGSMLNDARSHLFDSPHLVLFPAIAVMLAVLSFNFIGDALHDFLDPQTRLSAGL